jgi:UDP-glucose 4-epimerase
MSKVIVTGGAGFIGSHIAGELVKRGHQVIIIDNLSTGRLSNIEPTIGRKNVDFVRGSIVNLPLLRKLFSGVDYVFHQAAMSSVPQSIKNPKASHVTNITGTLNVLLTARDKGVKKVVFASSSSVYGDTPTLPKMEDMTPNPQSPYAVTKLTGEYYCKVFHKI